jgi:tRNA threonylcarbamoyladenosine biosynthesis protein TsaE
LSLRFDSEQALTQAAQRAAMAWRSDGIAPLIVGLKGDLGVGKTTFVRALLEALGHTGRVPSPTYTLLEQYALGDLSVVHLDLYRLKEAREIEFLGLRDWLAQPGVWLMVEWPERGGTLHEALDLEIRLSIAGDDSRLLEVQAFSERGRRASTRWLGQDIN